MRWCGIREYPGVKAGVEVLYTISFHAGVAVLLLLFLFALLLIFWWWGWQLNYDILNDI